MNVNKPVMQNQNYSENYLQNPPLKTLDHLALLLKPISTDE